MLFNRIAYLLIFCGLCLDDSSAQEKTGPAGDPPVFHRSLPYELAPLDKIITLVPESEPEIYIIGQEGNVTINGKSLHLAGIEKKEAIALLRKTAALDKRAEIKIEEFRSSRFTVVGEVYHQINHEMTDGPMRVMDAIATANGFTSLANTRRIKLMRENAGEIDVYELDLREVMLGRLLHHNILIKPGDVITVPKNFL